VNDEVAIRDCQGPVDSVRRQDVETRKPVGRLSEFHHERVAGLLEEVVFEVRGFAALDDLADPDEPTIDVQ